MDGSGKIAFGIVAAAVVLVVGFVCYKQYEHHRDMADAQAFIDQVDQQGRQFVEDNRRRVQRDARVSAEARERSRLARMLHSDERCIGGTVVRVAGSTYTQVLGSQGRPVACSGRYRL